MADLLDIAIIGTGPAGISAALTAAARGKSFKLFGSKTLSQKISKAHQINNYPGLCGKTGTEIAQAFLSDIEKLNIPINEERISNIYAMGNYFSILAGKNQYDSKTVIIATGTDFGKPLAGEEQFLGRGISYCATCDGMLYKNKTVAVIAYNKSQEKEADFLSQICAHVYYIPLYQENIQVDSKCELIHDIPKEITGTLKADSLAFASGKTISTNCVFILRESVAPSTLLNGLSMNGNHIAVDRSMKTNIPGCFAAGDITGLPYQIAKAVGEGNIAALSAVEYIK